MTSTLTLESLLARVEAATGPADSELNELAAKALGWCPRRVSGLGLSGRTRGSVRWFHADQPLIKDRTWTKGRAKPPVLIGPRSKARTIALLRALISQQAQEKGSHA